MAGENYDALVGGTTTLLHPIAILTRGPARNLRMSHFGLIQVNKVPIDLGFVG